MSISNKALLVSVSISQWTGRKLDRTATGTVEHTHATGKNVGNYTKRLLPDAAELRAIVNAAGAIRAFYLEQTLPWHVDGSRIISSKNYLDFTTAFRTLKGTFDRAVSDFLTAYPALTETARLELGDLYRADEYPSVKQLSKAFVCDISFAPVPDVTDFRVEILDSEKEAFLQRMHDTEAGTVRECMTRLHDVVSRAAVKLNAPESVFRDSLIDNVHEICALMPKLNVTDNAEVEAMRAQVSAIAGTIDPAKCRTDIGARTDAARALDDITSKMGAFMGVSQS
jgi:hypothetical protein